MQLWFGLATFWCSALIFWVEPLIGKQLLPLVGGAPAVWNICLLFFQIALLAGYLAAHGIARIRSARVQAGVYLALALVAIVTLPVRFDAAPADPTQPTLWLFGQLTLELLAPFIVLAAAAPLVQHWYSRTAAATARDPYFLYAASNAGSLIALLAFPVLIEPSLPIATQNSLWAVLFGGGVLLAATTALRGRARQPAVDAPAAAARVEVVSSGAGGHALSAAARPDARTLTRWAVLAAVPSGLLLGVTTYLTSDLAPVPLLWIVPLTIYLLTFIAAFGWLRAGLPPEFGRVIIIVAVLWCSMYRLHSTDPLWAIVTLHLVAFAVLALGAHTRLAEERPAPVHLTMYYLAISAGGAFGGAVVALLAPALFDSYIEYPLLVILAVWLNLDAWRTRFDLKRDLLPVMLVVAVIAAAFALSVSDRVMHGALAVGIPAIAAYMLSGRPIRFTLLLVVIVLSGPFDTQLHDRALVAERNFYGVLRVTVDGDGRYHELMHGTTLHGAATVARPDSSAGPTGVTPGGSEPLSYYWIGSPVADVIRGLQARNATLDVGVVGLGVGALAWYARPGERWTFYEINPAVVDLARDERWFGFLDHSRAGELDIVLGDARLMLEHASDDAYDLLVLDAFSSDAVPLHLLTREAVQLYLDKLRPGGLLVFHISNRYLDLATPIARVGEAVGMQAFLRTQSLTDEQQQAQYAPSGWLVLATAAADVPPASGRAQWWELSPTAGAVWTDDYSNIWSALIR